MPPNLKFTSDVEVVETCVSSDVVCHKEEQLRVALPPFPRRRVFVVARLCRLYGRLVGFRVVFTCLAGHHVGRGRLQGRGPRRCGVPCRSRFVWRVFCRLSLLILRRSRVSRCRRFSFLL